MLKLFYQLKRCPLCQQNGSGPLGCCEPCANELKNSLHIHYLDDNRISLGYYEGKLEKAIHALKFKQTTAIAELFADAMAKALYEAMRGTEREAKWRFYSLCAVPLHFSRYLHRGYNQAGLIAKAAAGKLHKPYEQLVSRNKATKQQATLGADERRNNVQNAFKAKLEAFGKSIVLIDDVYTTGATIASCAESLKRAGAKEIYIATVARARPSNRGWKA